MVCTKLTGAVLCHTKLTDEIMNNYRLW